MGKSSNIEQRKFFFCPTLTTYPLDHLIAECFVCSRFFAACCQDASFGGDWAEPGVKCCHHFRLVFTDGACSNNGKDYAKAGLGISVGVGDECSWSIPVDDAIDSQGPRTNQRAELLAAIEGLKKLHQVDSAAKEEHKQMAMRHKAEVSPEYILVTDSEYVTKGITEWFPVWRVRLSFVFLKRIH